MAPTGNFVLDKGWRAGAALTKFRAVKFGGVTSIGEVQVVPVAAISDVICGVVQFAVASTDIPRGKGALVRTLGISVFEAAGPIAVGQAVTINNVGQVQAAVTASGARIVGVCVGGPTTNAGDRASVLLNIFGPLA